MTTQQAIVQTIGKEKFNAQLEAGVADIEILKFACLTAFLRPGESSEATDALRECLVYLWDKTPDAYNLCFGVEGTNAK